MQRFWHYAETCTPAKGFLLHQDCIDMSRCADSERTRARKRLRNMQGFASYLLSKFGPAATGIKDRREGPLLNTGSQGPLMVWENQL
jgi:hypothetical protein